MVSTATVKVIDWGIHTEKKVTLIQTIVQTCQVKDPLLSKKEYCQDFGNTIKETMEQLSSSTFY